MEQNLLQEAQAAVADVNVNEQRSEVGPVPLCQLFSNYGDNI